MREYEVKLEARKNAIIAELEAPAYIVAAENKQQAKEFAYEIYQSETVNPLTRNRFKIVAERV